MNMESGGSPFPIMFFTAFLLTFALAAAGRGRNIQVPPAILKTIEGDGGDIVDCIHIYKQPAFSHPLLMNHSIQMEPSTEASRLRSRNGLLHHELKQAWHKYGKCPKHYVPIKRQGNATHHHFKGRPTPQNPKTGPDYHQHVVIEAAPSTKGTIHGVHATLNVWDPTVGPKDFSLSQLWLMAGTVTNLNTMEVGWHVYPQIHDGDTQPRFFIYWTNNGYQSGCYNVQGCPGFVQTNSEFLIGGSLESSTYGGQQYVMELAIQKDTSSGNWWLYVEGSPIGYWPPSLFTTIANAADNVEWGGEAYDNTGGGGLHTSTQMGSGHFPSEGFQKASYIRSFYYIDTSGSQINPTTVQEAVTIPKCYDQKMQNLNNEPYFFFGGPGCP